MVLLLKLLGDGHPGVQQDLHALHVRGVAHEDALRAQGLAVTLDTDLAASNTALDASGRGAAAGGVLADDAGGEPRGQPRLRVRTLTPAERAAAPARDSVDSEV